LPNLTSSFLTGFKVRKLKSSSGSGQRLKKKVPEKISGQGEVGGRHMPVRTTTSLPEKRTNIICVGFSSPSRGSKGQQQCNLLFV